MIKNFIQKFGKQIAVGIIAVLAVFLSIPGMTSAIATQWDRYIVGGIRPLVTTDKVLIGGTATSTGANLEVQGSFAIASSTTGCAQAGTGGIISFTGADCGTSTITVTQTAHGFSVGQWVGPTGSTTVPYALTNAVPGGIYQNVGIVKTVPDANTFVLQTSGDYTDTNLVPALTYFLSASTTPLGTVVGYPPLDAGNVSAPVSLAKSYTSATIQIGRPSEVPAGSPVTGINVGNDYTGSTYLSTSTMVAQAALVQKNLASRKLRIALPSWNSAAGIYNMREMSKYYKSLGYSTSYGVTGLSAFQNSTTYASWMAQIPSEAAWADANGIDTFYIGNEEDWFAELGQYGTITRAQVQADVLTMATTLKVAYPDMNIVYSTAQGTVVTWNTFAFAVNFGALDTLYFNMYDTKAVYEANIQYFQSQIGAKYAISEWASLYDYYRMVHAPYNYTDAQYASDLAYRSGINKKYGIESHFFALTFGGNSLASGQYNILLSNGTLLPGAAAAFGGGAGNQVPTTPIIRGDNQLLVLNDVKTGYIYCDITNCNFVAPEFGTLVLKARTLVESKAALTFRIRYSSTQYESTAVSSSGTITRDAVGTTPRFAFLDNVGIGTSTPDQKLTVNGAIAIENGNGLILKSSVGSNNYSTIAFNPSTSKVDTTWPWYFQDGISAGSAFSTIYPPSGGAIFSGAVGIGTSSPYANLSIWGSTTGKAFEISNSASTTVFSVSNTGFGTTTLAGLTISGSATSTSNVGLNLSGGCFSINNTCIGGSAFSNTIANGGTGSTAFSPNSIVTSNAAGTALIATTSDLTVSTLLASSTSGTSTFRGILQVLTRFITVIAAAFTPTTEGEIGIDTTSNQMKFYAGGAVRVIAPDIDSAFLLATSSMGTGTTTLKTAGFSRATTFGKFGCSARGGGTFVARLGDSTASSTSVVSATGLTTTFTTLSSNNSFTAGEAIWYEIGSVSGTVIDPSCSYNRTVDAD